MATIMADSLKVYDILKAAHLPEPQARAITEAIRESQTAIALDVRTVLDERLTHFATKADVAKLGAELRSEMADLKAELMRWMFLFWVGNMGATLGIIFAAFKFWAKPGG